MDTSVLTSLKIIESCGRANVPVILVGAPGIGKTAILEQFANQLGYKLDVQLLSTQDNTDVTGLPVRTTLPSGITTTEYATPAYQVRLMESPNTMLFLDELNNGAPAVQSAWLTILQSRRFPSGLKMNDATWIVGAMNPRSQSADGWELSAATANRLCFIPFETPFSFWKDWMLERQKSLPILFTNIPSDRLHSNELKWKRKVVEFLESTEGKEYEQKLPDISADPTTYGAITESEKEIFYLSWCSRRSWYNAAKVLSYLDGDKLAMNLALNGIVGYPATIAFLDFLSKSSTLPSVEEVLSDPSCVDWKSEIRVDEVNKLIRAIMQTVPCDDKVYDLFQYILKEGTADLISPYMYNDECGDNNEGFIQSYKGTKNVWDLVSYWETKEN